MATYLYTARSQDGALVTGELDAPEADDIRRALSGQGLIPVNVHPMNALFSWLSVLRPKLRVKNEDQLVFTRQFYTLFKAGMSMEAVLSTLTRQTENKNLRGILQKVKTSISSGLSLSKAFRQYEDVFGEIYVSMLSAGEEAGILEDVLNNLCRILEKESQIKSSIKSATLYPKIVMFVLAMASVVVMTFVVPKFASFFAHYKAELPLPTQMLMGASHFLVSYGYIPALLAVMGVIAWRRYARTRKGKVRVGEIQFQVPVFGPLHIKVANARFCHIFSALYRSGLPITRALMITAGTIENGAFYKEVETVAAEVTKGKTISEAMAAARYFSPVIIDATAVGEQTGSLDEMLEAMGEHYDLEIQHTLKNFATLLEPILLAVVFGMVTLFALAIFLPIWNMSRAITGH